MPSRPPSCCLAEGCSHPQGGLYTRASSVTPDLSGSRSNPLLPHSQCLPQAPSPLTSAPTRASYLAFLTPSSLYLATRSSFGNKNIIILPLLITLNDGPLNKGQSPRAITRPESLCSLTAVSHTVTLQFVYPHPFSSPQWPGHWAVTILGWGSGARTPQHKRKQCPRLLDHHAPEPLPLGLERKLGTTKEAA